MSRIVCVSNRVSLPDPETGEIKAGGLAVGIKAALENHGGCIWFGWDGAISSCAGASLPRRINKNGVTFITISLTEAEYEGYYKKMSNGTLWPFMHGLGDHIEENEPSYETYKKVNEMFARRLKPYLRPDDIVWVHDYHLIPLGRCLRELGMKNRILFFNHIPVPGCSFVHSPSVPHSLRKQYRDLVNDLFYYDLTGFQSFRDFENFTGYLNYHTRTPARFSTVILANGQRQARFGVFPISIETFQLERKAKMAVSGTVVRDIRNGLGSCRMIVGAERLDYTKGIHNRIEGIAHLFELFPQYREQLKYLQVAPLSRDDVKEYKTAISRTRNAVKDIQEQFENERWQPILYTEENIRREDLAGCFRISDIGLVTPLIDGQNLVAKEYLASQDPAHPGVLVLSKYAGAAEELGELGTILVDPYDPEHIAVKVRRALEMPLEERASLHQAALMYLRRHDIYHWADKFLSVLMPSENALAFSLPAPRMGRGTARVTWNYQ